MDPRSRHFWSLLPSLEAIRRRRYQQVMRQRIVQQQMSSYPVVDSVVRHLLADPDAESGYRAVHSYIARHGYAPESLYNSYAWRPHLLRNSSRAQTMRFIRRYGEFPYPGNVRMAGGQFDSRRQYGDDEWPLRPSVQRVNDDWITMIQNGDIDPGDRGDWHDNDIADQ